MKRFVLSFAFFCFAASILLSTGTKAGNYDLSAATVSWNANPEGTVKGYYFDGEKHIEIQGDGEITMSWYLYNDINPATVKSINIGNGVYMSGENANSLFFQWYDLEDVKFGNPGEFTKKLTNLNQMFSYCYQLKNVDLSGFDTSNVSKMTYVFSNCSNLETADISGLDTSKVTDMSGMFWDCKNLKSIHFGNIDTSKVTDMSNFLSGCGSLTSIDMSRLNTSAVHEMNSMFEGCKSLTELDLSKMDTAMNVNYLCMFKGCSSLKTLDISGFDMSRDYDTSSTYMLEGCDALEKLVTPKTGGTNTHLPKTMYDGAGVVYKRLPASMTTLYSTLAETGNTSVSVEPLKIGKKEKVSVKDRLMEAYKETDPDAVVKKTKFKSDNKKIVKVNKNGDVTGGKRTGTATITMYVKTQITVTKANGKQKKKLGKWTEAAKVTIENVGTNS